MHPSRISFLATKHAPQRAVTARDEHTYGTRLTLECGHEAMIAPHFDASHTKQCRCYECGKQFVLAAPQYASEFQISK